MKDYTAVRHYLQWIPTRIKFLQNFSENDSSMEVMYYTELYKNIREWGKNHVLFYKFIMGKMTMAELLPIFGCAERTFYRIMKTQKDDLIKYIQEQEAMLDKKYPFVEFDMGEV